DSDPNVTVLDSHNEDSHNEEELPFAVSPSSKVLPITGEVKPMAEQDSGELLIPMEEAATSEVEEEVSAKQDAVYQEEIVAPLSEQPTGELPVPPSVET